MEDQIKQKIEAFFSNGKNLNFKKGETVIHADENPSSIFYLKVGLVKEYFLTKKGDEFVVNIFKPGTFFPVSSAVTETHNNFYFEAAMPCEVYKVTKEETLTFLKENPDILFDLLKRVYIGTNGLLLKIGYQMSGSAYEKLIIELLIYAKRFGKKQNEHSITFTVSEKDLGMYAGLTRETVSRELKKLKEKELAIFHQGNITIPHLNKLEKELL